MIFETSRFGMMRWKHGLILNRKYKVYYSSEYMSNYYAKKNAIQNNLCYYILTVNASIYFIKYIKQDWLRANFW